MVAHPVAQKKHKSGARHRCGEGFRKRKKKSHTREGSQSRTADIYGVTATSSQVVHVPRNVYERRASGGNGLHSDAGLVRIAPAWDLLD